MRDETLNELNLTLPTYEQIKEAYFDEVKKCGIGCSEEYLLEEIFNPKSDLWTYDASDDMYIQDIQSEWTGDADDILSKINEDFYGNHSLYAEIDPFFLVVDLIVALNPNIKGFEDEVDFYEYLANEQGYDVTLDLTEDFQDKFRETPTEELKEVILSIKRGER